LRPTQCAGGVVRKRSHLDSSPSQSTRLANEPRAMSTPVRLPQPSSRLLQGGNSPQINGLCHFIVRMLSFNCENIVNSMAKWDHNGRAIHVPMDFDRRCRQLNSKFM
jgi:hypothetical protein